MFTKIILPVLAGIGLLLGLVAVVISRLEPPTPVIPIPPPISPYKHYVSAAGMVEASSHNISIGSSVTQVMDQLLVEPGDFVPKGTPLFTLRSNAVKAQLQVAQEALAVAQAKYQRLLDYPDPRDVDIMEATLESKKANYLNQLSKFELIENLDNPRAVSRDEQNQRRFGAIEARYALKEVQEELAKMLSGVWVADLEVARAEVKEAKANVTEAQRVLDKYTINAPFSGTVLRVNRFPGELVVSDYYQEEPIILFGVIDPLYVRVDIDEEEIWRIERGKPGTGFVRGNRKLSVPLEFVRIDPYLVPKRALNGTSTELVDTRVLQVLYKFDRGDLPIYPGQLLDVYVEAKPNMVEER